MTFILIAGCQSPLLVAGINPSNTIFSSSNRQSTEYQHMQLIKGIAADYRIFTTGSNEVTGDIAP